MKSHIFKILITAVFGVLLSCASGSKTTLETPLKNQCLLVGAILLENNGLEDVYEAKTSRITVVIVGKWEENGKEMTKGYRVKTGENGYYMIQNVPPGSYVIKGIEADVGYETRLILTSRWEGNSQIFYPTDTMVDQTVRVWPPPITGPIIDMNIAYFSIDAAMRTYNDSYPELRNTTLVLKDQKHTMKNPVDYFREKYPNWEWFKK
jgi:hypothetical protein